MADYKNRLDEFLTRLGVDLKAPQRCVSGGHADDHPSMYRHNGEWWHCFSCGGNFNIYHFAARKLNVKPDKNHFRAVSEFIEDTLGLPRPTRKPENVKIEMGALDKELKDYINNFGKDAFAKEEEAKLKKINFTDKLLDDIDNSQVGRAANAILEKFKGVPLAGAPSSESVFADYFCHNFYPHVIYTNEFGFYIYNYEKGVFQTDLAEAVIFQIVRRLAKKIENFDVSTSRKLSGTLKFISMHPLVFKTEKEFDQNDFSLNAGGAVFNLRTLESAPASPEAPMKMSTPIKPENGRTPAFDKFLSDVSKGDADMEAYLLRYMGYALTGSTREQIFLNFFGGGKNGKSTFIELALHLFGAYATTMPEDLIIDGGNAAKSENSAAILQNKRLAVLADCNRGALNDSMIKRITGGDTIRARHLYRDGFEFTPKSKLIIGTNQKLRLRDTGESVRRRLRLVPFEFYAEDADKTLLDKLKEEASGILFKLIREAYDYLYLNALPVCRRIEKASQQYIDEENPFAAFFQERLEFGADCGANTVEVWTAYKAWAEAAEVKAMSKRALAQELERVGCPIVVTRASPRFQGVEVAVNIHCSP
jgi:P4 family phage/plasmid primase-like protien